MPPREIHITAWDKAAVAAIEKAISNSSLGLNPVSQGNVIIINMPPLTLERREELIKLIKSITEKCRIKIRTMRDESNKKTANLFNEKEINEDQKFKLKERIQETVDGVNGKIEDLLNKKIKEISE